MSIKELIRIIEENLDDFPSYSFYKKNKYKLALSLV